nr:NADH dehydrogenase subunit 6 [Nephrurus amyae]
MYLFLLLLLCILGVLGVAANPSPYYGVVGLILATVGGCGVLVVLGGSFVSLVLFLIYLGGMMVVFVYSVALAAEPFPQTWLDFDVGVYLVGGLVLVFLLGGLCVIFGGLGLLGGDGGGWFCVRVDMGGVVLLYSAGGGFLVLGGLGLILVLFVVLELTRGLARGGLRVV